MNLLYANDRKGRYPASLYADTRLPFDPQPALRGATRADVVVVGAGYTGLSAARDLAAAGLDVVVLDAHRVGFGASGRNGGQVGSGQRLDVDDLERIAGRERARALWDLAQEAKAMVRDIAKAASLPYHPGIAHAVRNDAELRHAHQMAEKLARDYDYPEIEPLDQKAFAALIPIKGARGGDIDHGAGSLHPLNLAIALAQQAIGQGARLYEQSHVHHIRHAARAGQKSVVQTDTGHVECDHVILAGNGYLGHLDPKVGARVMPINNYIVATEPLGARAAEVMARPMACHDTKFVVNYWRLDEDGRLIFGGGETMGYRFPDDIFAKVRGPLLSLYPGLANVRLTHAWGGTLAITRSRMPAFLRPAPNCLSASGFSGHGVAMATLAGRLMARAIQGQAAGFDTMAALSPPPFPGGGMLRWPLLVAGMTWFSLRDRLGF